MHDCIIAIHHDLYIQSDTHLTYTTPLLQASQQVTVRPTAIFYLWQTYQDDS